DAGTAVEHRVTRIALLMTGLAEDQLVALAARGRARGPGSGALQGAAAGAAGRADLCAVEDLQYALPACHGARPVAPIRRTSARPDPAIGRGSHDARRVAGEPQAAAAVERHFKARAAAADQPVAVAALPAG